MAELINVLVTRNQTGVAGVDERQTFTVNNAVADVEMDAFVAGQGILRPAFSFNYKVKQKDNITVLSMGISLPYSYSPSTRSVYIKLFWNDGVGSGVFNIGSNNLIELPFGNYELSIGAFVPWPTPRALPYWIEMLIGANPELAEDRLRISMIGSPALIVNGTKLPVTAFMKIAYNLPLVV